MRDMCWFLLEHLALYFFGTERRVYFRSIHPFNRERDSTFLSQLVSFALSIPSCPVLGVGLGVSSLCVDEWNECFPVSEYVSMRYEGSRYNGYIPSYHLSTPRLLSRFDDIQQFKRGTTLFHETLLFLAFFFLNFFSLSFWLRQFSSALYLSSSSWSSYAFPSLFFSFRAHSSVSSSSVQLFLSLSFLLRNSKEVHSLISST